MNARVGPPGFPVVQARLRFFETLETKALQRRFLRVADSRFDFSFAIGTLNPAWHGDDAVMCQDILEQRIDCGVVDIRREHAFPEVIQNQNTGAAAKSAKRRLMQLGPRACAGTEDQ